MCGLKSSTASASTSPSHYSSSSPSHTDTNSHSTAHTQNLRSSDSYKHTTDTKSVKEWENEEFHMGKAISNPPVSSTDVSYRFETPERSPFSPVRIPQPTFTLPSHTFLQTVSYAECLLIQKNNARLSSLSQSRAELLSEVDQITSQTNIINRMTSSSLS